MTPTADYAAELSRALLTVDPTDLKRAVDLIRLAASAGNVVWLCGNGGCAALAGHGACDLGLNAGVRVRAVSLCAAPSYSATANDHGMFAAFSQQVRMTSKPGDVLLGMTTSELSENVRAATWCARESGMTTIGFVGRAGPQHIRTMHAWDVRLYVPSMRADVCEDCFGVLLHLMTRMLRDGA